MLPTHVYSFQIPIKGTSLPPWFPTHRPTPPHPQPAGMFMMSFTASKVSTSPNHLLIFTLVSSTISMKVSQAIVKLIFKIPGDTLPLKSSPVLSHVHIASQWWVQNYPEHKISVEKRGHTKLSNTLQNPFKWHSRKLIGWEYMLHSTVMLIGQQHIAESVTSCLIGWEHTLSSARGKQTLQ